MAIAAAVPSNLVIERLRSRVTSTASGPLPLLLRKRRLDPI
jgi:hypothetical protein